MKVGEPLTLVAFAGDPDNLPARRDGKPQPRDASGRRLANRPRRRRRDAVAGAREPRERHLPAAVVDRRRRAGPGCGLSWIVYRGKAAGRDLHARSDEDVDRHARVRELAVVAAVRRFPMPPPDGKWTAQATFSEPGTYVLRAVASDGSLFTYDNVTVTVTR